MGDPFDPEYPRKENGYFLYNPTVVNPGKCVREALINAAMRPFAA
jgi:hypothetical protein